MGKSEPSGTFTQDRLEGSIVGEDIDVCAWNFYRKTNLRIHSVGMNGQRRAIQPVVRYFIWLGLLAFILHFFLTTLHCLPEGSLSPRWRSYSHLYSYPQFHQGWGLFAPQPQDRNKRLEIRYAKGGTWSDWIHPEESSFPQHKRYRVFHYSKLFHTNQGVAFHLWRSLDEFNDKGQEGEQFYPTSMGYTVAMEYAGRYLQHFRSIEAVDSLAVRLFLEQPHSDEYEMYDFPVHRP